MWSWPYHPKFVTYVISAGQSRAHYTNSALQYIVIFKPIYIIVHRMYELKGIDVNVYMIYYTNSGTKQFCLFASGQ